MRERLRCMEYRKRNYNVMTISKETMARVLKKIIGGILMSKRYNEPRAG